VVEHDEPVGFAAVGAVEGGERIDQFRGHAETRVAEIGGEGTVVCQGHHGQPSPGERDVEPPGPIVIQVIRRHRLAISQRERTEAVRGVADAEEVPGPARPERPQPRPPGDLLDVPLLLGLVVGTVRSSHPSGGSDPRRQGPDQPGPPTEHGFGVSHVGSPFDHSDTTPNFVLQVFRHHLSSSFRIEALLTSGPDPASDPDGRVKPTYPHPSRNDYPKYGDYRASWDNPVGYGSGRLAIAARIGRDGRSPFDPSRPGLPQ
jgi:hypothetical protein